MTIFEEISAERVLQDKRFGMSFDDMNTPYNWAAYICQYATRHLIGDPRAVVAKDFRADMVKVAALTVAALEAMDRT